MTKYRLGMIVLLVMLISLSQIGVASAGVRDGLRWTAGCDGFSSNGGGIILNRDNTGNGRELFVISAIDAYGNVLYGPTADSFYVGSSLYIAEGVFFPYRTAPQADPILVSLVSPAGNGQEEQIIYSALGFCEDVPTITTGLTIYDAIPEVVDGTTSPSTPLNIDPPRPTNPDGIGTTRLGYLIVNTSSLNLRSGDGPEYTVVGRVAGSTELIVLGRNADRSWWFVQVGDIRGWVNNTLVIVRGDLTDVPIVPVQGDISLPRLFVFDATTLYSAPSANSLPVCSIEGDLEYLIIGTNGAGTWDEIEAQCNFQTVTGWVLEEEGAVRNSGDLPIPITDN